MDDNVKPKDGKGMYEYIDGSVYDGEWRDGKRHGQGEYQDDYGSYDGAWIDDKQHGKGTYKQNDGVIYVGDFVNNRLEGKGTLTKPDGSIYVGEFKNGKLHGNGTMTYSDGTITGGIWIKGKLAQEYPKLKVTKSAFNDCADVFSMELMVTGDIIVLHNQMVEYMFDTDTTIGEPFMNENTRNICPYIFLKSNFDEYIKTNPTKSNPNTRELMTEDNCKTYVLIIVDENAPASAVDENAKRRSRSRSKAKSRSPTLRARSRARSRSMSRGGKRTRRRI